MSLYLSLFHYSLKAFLVEVSYKFEGLCRHNKSHYFILAKYTLSPPNEEGHWRLATLSAADKQTHLDKTPMKTLVAQSWKTSHGAFHSFSWVPFNPWDLFSYFWSLRLGLRITPRASKKHLYVRQQELEEARWSIFHDDKLRVGSGCMSESFSAFIDTF